MKQITALLFCFLLLFSLAACSNMSTNNEKRNDTDTKQFLKAMDELCTSGDELSVIGLSLQAESYYAFAGASVSSLRYAVEYILWLKGEGENLDSFTADSRYSGWDQIAGICYASPYPYYFEGLIYHVQNKKEEAKEAYTNTLLNPAYPEDGVNFYYLKNKEVKDLYALRDELRQKEDAIYSKYTPSLVMLPRDPYLFDTSYLRAKSAESVAAGEFAAAASYGKAAVKNDPLDVENLKNAVLCCIYNGEAENAAVYLDEGLLLAPNDEGLQTIYQSFVQIRR